MREESDLFYWLALSLAPGVGPLRFAELLRRFKTPRGVFEASAKELALVPRLPERTAAALRRFDWADRVQEELGKVRARGLRLITLAQADYPPRLRQIPDPPPVLWVEGQMVPQDELAVAIVGSRRATVYGQATTGRLAGELAEAGVSVVSGLAPGIDAAAHRGCLAAGGRTLGVLGCGLDVIYPRPNRDLFELIPRSGALLSEFPLGTQPEAGHFPRRNRIIAGLSLGVVVVEAAERSGALITARLALEQNREVFAVPGRVGSDQSRGTHALLRQGARLVERAADILEEIAPQLRDRVGRRPRKESGPPELSPEETKVWELLSEEPVHVDQLSRATGLSPARLAPLLLNLELKGQVRQMPGGRYIRGEA